MNVSQFQRSAAAALALAICLAGCRTWDDWRLDRERRAAARQGTIGLGAPVPNKKLNAREKADVEMALARVMEKKGPIDDAIKAYHEVLRNDKRRPDAHHRLAVLYDKKGDWKASAKAYQEALKYDPKNAEIHGDLGYSGYLQGRWNEAEKSLRRAIELDPGLARAHNNLGLLLGRTGRREEALAEFQRAGLKPGQAHANLAFAMLWDEQYQASAEEFDRALTIDPKSPLASQGRATLRTVTATTADAAAIPAPAATPSEPDVKAPGPVPPPAAKSPLAGPARETLPTPAAETADATVAVQAPVAAPTPAAVKAARPVTYVAPGPVPRPAAKSPLAGPARETLPTPAAETTDATVAAQAPVAAPTLAAMKAARPVTYVAPGPVPPPAAKSPLARPVRETFRTAATRTAGPAAQAPAAPRKRSGVGGDGETQRPESPAPHAVLGRLRSMLPKADKTSPAPPSPRPAVKLARGRENARLPAREPMPGRNVARRAPAELEAPQGRTACGLAAVTNHQSAPAELEAPQGRGCVLSLRECYDLIEDTEEDAPDGAACAFITDRPATQSKMKSAK